MIATKALTEVQAEFKCRVLDKIRSAKLSQPRSEPPTPPTFHVNCSCMLFTRGHLWFRAPSLGNHGRADVVSNSSSSSSESDSDEESDKPESDFEKNEVVTKSEVRNKLVEGTMRRAFRYSASKLIQRVFIPTCASTKRASLTRDRPANVRGPPNKPASDTTNSLVKLRFPDAIRSPGSSS